MKRNQFYKNIYITICMFIMIFLSTFMFYSVWLEFVIENNQTGHLTGLGNLGMAVIIYTLLYTIIGNWIQTFSLDAGRKANVIAGQVLTLFTVNIIEVLISMAITGQFRFLFEFTFRYFILFLVQSFVLCVLDNYMINLMRYLFKPLDIIEIYGKPNQLLAKISGIPFKYHVVDSIHYSVGEDKLEEIVKNADSILINDVPARVENHLVKMCFRYNRQCHLVPKISDIIIKSSSEINVVDTPIYVCKNKGLSLSERILKRAFDIILSGLSLIFLSPVFILTAIAIKLEDNGPVFFRQERSSLGGERFWILKFRSMIVDAEKDGRSIPAGENDPRITKVGKIIRAFRIDELPQLVNILFGDMSIVGPRPERVEHVEKYSAMITEFTFREKVKGGLTGYAQVFGKYNTTALDKLKLDLIYITNYTPLLDLQIIFETIKILVRKDSTEGFSLQRVQEIKEMDDSEDYIQ